MPITDVKELRAAVDAAVEQVEITDVHTHLYTPCFGDMLLWGVDELLTYHYLVAEFFRWTDMPYDEFWSMSKRQQADLIWKTLFIENSPYSEACRGVLTVLNKLGLDVAARDLEAYRSYFAAKTIEEYVDRSMVVAGIGLPSPKRSMTMKSNKRNFHSRKLHSSS